jgi:xylulokinase
MGVVEPGAVSATIGTSGVVFAHSDTVVPNPGGVLQSFCHAVSGKWCVFGCMLSAGASLEWARGVLCPARKPSFDAMLHEAGSSPPGARGLFFLPYLDGERCPHPDPNARACWIGLSRLHSRADMIRAVVEGVTFGMADQVVLMRERGVSPDMIHLSGGGAKSAFLRQLQADIYGVPTVCVETENASALGAALLAGVGTGVWKNVREACGAAVRTKEKSFPRPKLAAFYAERHHEYRRLYPALRERFEGLSAIGC